jgi:hypothetical protein
MTKVGLQLRAKIWKTVVIVLGKTGENHYIAVKACRPGVSARLCALYGKHDG